VTLLVLASAVQPARAEQDFGAFDQPIIDLMARYNIPGATIAVARDGKLAIARAYGFADRERKIPPRPDSLFRIGSISKPVTAAAILKLAEEGRLDLDAKAFPMLDQLQPPKGKTADPRIPQITVRQLLHHAGGWDRAVSGDIIGAGPDAARTLNVPAPVGPEDFIRYMLGRPLDFDPGSRFAYSNVGYIVMGRIIEKVTGTPYEDYVKGAVLKPAGIRRMRLGGASLAERADGEVMYYDVPGAPLVWTQVRGGPPVVPAPYAYPLGMMNSCGAWIASSIDLVRFALALDPQSGRDLILQPETVRQMREDRIPAWAGPNVQHFYGLGWAIDLAADGAETWWHTGGLPGTVAILAHRSDGIVYAVVFNSCPREAAFGDMIASGDSHQAFAAAIDSIREWPEADLFDLYQ
jgi:N-acyl-D-amino-acid deacylase